MQNKSDRPVLLRCRACKALNRVPYDRLMAHPRCGKCKTPLHVPKSPLNVTTAAFEQVISGWPEYVLVEFWSPRCGHCRTVEPVVNDLASARAGVLLVARVDIDSEPALASRFSVNATPTFIMLKNKKQLARLDGAPQEAFQLFGWVDQFIG